MAIPDALSWVGLDFGPDYVDIAKNSTKGPGRISPEDWNSLIGIITAIVGNVLISFALNTQRYAHLRLAKEAGAEVAGAEHIATANQDTQSLSQGRGNQNNATGSGQNFKADDQDDSAAHETDPLLPKSQDTQSSSSSESTAIAQDEKSDEPQPRKNYLRSPYWWIGIILMVIGEAGNFLAYGFAPASIVSPLGVVALISNCLIAPFMLKEQFRKRDLFGVIVAVAGAVTVVLSAKDSNPKLDQDQIWSLIKRWEFLAYLVVTLVMITVLMIASNKYGQRSIMIDIGLVGLFGGYTALSTKGVASLFSSRLFDIFAFPITYLLVLILVVTAVMQIKYVNRALQRFNSTEVIPTQFVMFTIFVVVGSAVLYRDFEKTDASNVGKFVAGVALTFLGVWSITGGRNSSSNIDDVEGDEEHEIDLVQENAAIKPSTPKAKRSVHDSLGEHYADSPASFATASSRPRPTPTKAKTSSSRSTNIYSQSSRSDPALSRKKLPSTSVAEASLPTANPPSPKTPLHPSNRPFSPTHTASDTTVTQLSHNNLTPNSVYNTPQTISSSVPRHIFNRHSIASGMTPGPYLSPLSAGLSVVVADNLRRGSSTGNARPRIRSRSLRQSQPNTTARNYSLSDAGDLDASEVAPDGPLTINTNVDDHEPLDRRTSPSGLKSPPRPDLGDRGVTVEVASAAIERRAENESPERRR